MINSGAAFDIAHGPDVLGDQLFRARPALATDPNQPGVIKTAYGFLDPNPKPGEATLPRNFGRSPGSVTVNLRLARTFGFGPARERAGGAGDFSGGGDRGGDRGPRGGGPGGGGDHGGGGGRGGPPMGGMRGGGGGGMGGGGGPPHRRYNPTLSIPGPHPRKHGNPGPIFRTVTSPLFGHFHKRSGSLR